MIWPLLCLVPFEDNRSHAGIRLKKKEYGCVFYLLAMPLMSICRLVGRSDACKSLHIFSKSEGK